MDSESTPLVKTILTEIENYKSFRDINIYLHLITHTSQISPNPWSFNYQNISGLVMIIGDRGNNGIFLGLEQTAYPHIYADFAYERRNNVTSSNLKPLFIANRSDITRHVYSTLEQIKNRTFTFTNLEEGEYLEQEVKLVLEHAEEVPLEEEIPLLELFDLISEQLAEINAERVKKNRPVVEFREPYEKGIDIIRRLPLGTRTDPLERRLNM